MSETLTRFLSMSRSPHFKLNQRKKMAIKQRFGSIKRFGARYGRSLKEKFAIIEAEQRKRHKCPYCHQVQVKRLEMGIWYCRKCKTKFTGKAYSINKKIVVDEEKPTKEKAEGV